MLNGPFSPWPSFTEEEASAVHDLLLTNKVNYWTGKEARLFETEFADFCEAKHAIALANGTVALDVALYALGVSAGDEVIVTSRTFIATVSSVVLRGGRPVFVDVDYDSQNICPQEIEAAITAKTKAIICVHLAGWSCEMDSIMALAKKYSLAIIEDCAQAHGAKYKGRPVGSIGDVGCWSFCQDKIISTGGEGGMVTTQSKDLWLRMWAYKDHGKSWDAVHNTEQPPGFRWLHESFGTNLRMTEIQAVIGRIQLRRMDGWIRARQKNAQAIWNSARELNGLRVPVIPAHIEHAVYKCYLFVELDRLRPNWSRDKIIEEVVKAGVPCFSGSCSEVYKEQAFVDAKLQPAEPLPIAHTLGETSIMFLVHPTLSESEIRKTCNVIKEVSERAFLSGTNIKPKE